jgi:hypothetical protein
MTTGERQAFARKKLVQARKSKGLCIQCGKNPAILKPDGTRGSYCKKCLEMFRTAREKLVKKRGSCVRCPNPPQPGKKLCKKCEDELGMQRLNALATGLCIRCKKAPAEGDTLYCKKCMKIKVAMNKRRRRFKKDWQSYADDVLRTNKPHRKPADLE